MDAFSQVVQIFSAIAVGGSAVVVAVVAVKGLNQWRAQLKGNAEYEVARRLLRAIRAARDNVSNYRAQYTHPSEVAGRERADEKWEEAFVLDEEFARRNRLVEVQKVWPDFQQAKLEAEVLLDDFVSESLMPLTNCVHRLFAAHNTYFFLALDRAHGKRVIEDALEKERRVVYFQGPDDEYSKTLDSAVQSALIAFKPYLK